MEYPYIDYYKSDLDGEYHLVIHYGPDRKGTYRCKLLMSSLTLNEIKTYLKENNLKAKRRRKK